MGGIDPFGDIMGTSAGPAGWGGEEIFIQRQILIYRRQSAAQMLRLAKVSSSEVATVLNEELMTAAHLRWAEPR